MFQSCAQHMNNVICCKLCTDGFTFIAKSVLSFFLLLSFLLPIIGHISHPIRFFFSHFLFHSSSDLDVDHFFLSAREQITEFTIDKVLFPDLLWTIWRKIKVLVIFCCFGGIGKMTKKNPEADRVARTCLFGQNCQLFD